MDATEDDRDINIDRFFRYYFLYTYIAIVYIVRYVSIYINLYLYIYILFSALGISEKENIRNSFYF